VPERKSGKRIVLFFCALAAVAVAVHFREGICRCFFPRSYWSGEVSSCEAAADAQQIRCSSLQQLLQRTTETSTQSKLSEYYGFREVEVSDDEAWQRAERKVESNLSAISNDLVNCQATLQKKQQALEAARAELAKVR
jgi:multidrug resistance efflux pump